MKVPLARYYRSFLDLKGLIASASFIPPILHYVGGSSAFVNGLYPPLGDFQVLGVVSTVGFLLLVTFLVYIAAEFGHGISPKTPKALALGFVCAVCLLIPLYVCFIMSIPVPSEGKEVMVSVGFSRTRFANTNYGDFSDREMLHDAGPWEEQIQKLWTRSSLSIVRINLWLFYTLSLACWISAVSLAAYRDACDASIVPNNKVTP